MTAEETTTKWFTNSQQISPVRLARIDRKALVKKFCEFGYTQGAEIGVDRGRFSEFMCQVNPDLHLLCVDPWERHWRGESRHKSALERLTGYKCTLLKEPSLEAVRAVPDRSLDFVYIDGDHHFDFVMTDIIAWVRKVRIGGIVAGHDYYRFRQAGVVDAVDIYTRMHGIDKWFLTDERTPTWFWLREEEIWPTSVE